MAKLWAVLRREFLERVRSKWFIVTTLLGPVFYAVLIVTPLIVAARTKPSSEVAHILVLDASETGLGDRIAAALADGAGPGAARPAVRAVTPTTLAAAETTATRAVTSKSVPGYLVLEFGSVADADPAKLTGLTARYAGRNASSIPDMERLREAVRRSVLAARLQREGLDPARVQELTAVRVPLTTERLTERGRGGSGMASVVFGYVVAILLYTMIVLYGQAILRGVLEEKTTRVAEVVLSSTSPDVLLAGKVVGVGSVALLQQLVWIAAGVGLFHLRAPLIARFGVTGVQIPSPNVSAGAAALLVLFFVLGFVLYAALFAAVGAMVSNQEDAQQASMPVVMLLVLSMVFMYPTLLNPTSTLARVTSWFPLTAPILMPLRMTMLALPWYEIVATVLGIALMAALVVWLAARIYRVGLLMYGKRPSVGELMRWVRYAS